MENVGTFRFNKFGHLAYSHWPAPSRSGYFHLFTYDSDFYKLGEQVSLSHLFILCLDEDNPTWRVQRMNESTSRATGFQETAEYCYVDLSYCFIQSSPSRIGTMFVPQGQRFLFFSNIMQTLTCELQLLHLSFNYVPSLELSFYREYISCLSQLLLPPDQWRWLSFAT